MGTTRSFYLEDEVSSMIDAEIKSLPPNMTSKLVNQLLKEALRRRAKLKVSEHLTTALEATALTAIVSVLFWVALVFI